LHGLDASPQLLGVSVINLDRDYNTEATAALNAKLHETNQTLTTLLTEQGAQLTREKRGHTQTRANLKEALVRIGTLEAQVSELAGQLRAKNP
jgi:hypothetical protein